MWKTYNLLHFGRLTNAERTVNDDNNNNYYIAAFAHGLYRGDSPPQDVRYSVFIIISSGWRPTCGRVYSIMYTIIMSFVYALGIINSRAQSIRYRVAVNDHETDLDIL